MTDFRPHAGQVRAIDAVVGARYSLLVCGRRWGKSKFLARVLAAEALKPQGVIWSIAPTYELTKRVYRPLKFLLTHALPKKLAAVGLRPVTVRRALDSTSERIMELSNGTIVQAKSADNPEGLLGEGVTIAGIDEMARLKEETFEEYIMPTLLDTDGRMVGATTPTGFDWIHKRFALGQPGEQRDRDWLSIQSPSWENEYLPEGAVDRFRRLLAQVSFDQEIGAQFTARRGRVFGDFSRARHVMACPLDPALPVELGIDFGYRTFAACVLQYGSSGQVRIPMTFEFHDIDTPHAVARLAAQPWADRVSFIACDPAGDGRDLQTGISDVQVVRAGFPKAHVTYSTQPKHRDPEWRAARIRDLLWSAAGQSRIVVDPRATEAVAMLEGSIYPKPTPGYGEKGQPLKGDGLDHMRDAFGYWVANRIYKAVAEIGGLRPW